MHVPDTSSESGYYLAYLQHGSNGKRLRPPPTVTDLPLDDNFDAATVTKDSEVYRMWEDDARSAYDDAGYLRRQIEFKDIYGGDVRMRRNSESLVINTGQDNVRTSDGGRVRDAESDRGSSRRIRVGSSQGKTELVEHRVLEDGPTRTISVWREQVANSADDNVTHIDLNAPSRRNGHRKTLSGNLSQSSASGMSRESRGKDIGRNARTSLERNLPRSPLQRTFVGDVPQQSPSYDEKGRPSYISTGSPRRMAANPPSPRNVSPSTSRSLNRVVNNSGSSKTNSTSTLELLLSSCQPSLLHLTQALEDLGIRKEEHLRAIAKMNDETRDREVREEALKRGVTVLEWAIFLDKLQGLYSYDDMYT